MAGDFFFSTPCLSVWAPKEEESELRIVEGRVVRLAADLIGPVRAPVISISAPFGRSEGAERRCGPEMVFVFYICGSSQEFVHMSGFAAAHRIVISVLEPLSHATAATPLRKSLPSKRQLGKRLATTELNAAEWIRAARSRVRFSLYPALFQRVKRKTAFMITKADQ